MTRSFPGSLPATLAVLCIVFAACGDDDNPAAADSPCDDAGVACATVRLSAAEMTYSEIYDGAFNETFHEFIWDPGSDVIRGYAPGARVIVTVIFEPPIEVRYNHPSQFFVLLAGPSGCYNAYTDLTPNVDSDDWAVMTPNAQSRGECNTGASALELSAILGPIVTNQRLRRVVFDLVVPDTYTDGAFSGSSVLPGDLNLFQLFLSSSITGDTRNDPPVWQGTFEPTVKR